MPMNWLQKSTLFWENNSALDNRLKFISGLVPNGCRVADIGTDHSYLPVFLRKNNICTSVIATDIRQKPLAVARKNVEKSGQKNIDLRLCDGLELIGPNEVDEIIIAGMGGEVIAGIIGRSRWIKTDKKRLILQPMSHSEDLRRYLFDNGFKIEKERAVQSDGRVYTVIIARYTGEYFAYSDIDVCLGKLTENIGVDEKKYIKWRRKVLFEKSLKIKDIDLKQGEYQHLIKTVAEIDEILKN